jgi:hypothetical protein
MLLEWAIIIIFALGGAVICFLMPAPEIKINRKDDN